MEENMLLYTTLSLILFLVLTIKLFLQPKQPHKNLPPSPPSLPLLGHLLFLKPPFHRTFHRLSQQYGTVFSLFFGSHRVLVVSSSSAAQECFTKNDIVLANRPCLLPEKHIQYNSTTLFASPYGDHWRNLRRIGTTHIFSSAKMEAFSDIRRDEINRLILKLSENSQGNFVKVEMKSLLSHMSFNIIMRMVAGKRYYGGDASNDEESKKFVEIIRETFAIGGTNLESFLPFLNWFRKESYEKRVMRAAEKIDGLLQGLVDEHRSNILAGDEVRNVTMIHHMLSLQKSQPEYYNDQIIKGLMLVLLMGGTDTTSVTLEWAMSNLLDHPHILNKAKVEMNNLLGHGQDQRLIEESDISKLPYLQSIISETLRLYPAAPLLAPHFSSDDCIIDGFDVPRGTLVLINGWAIHRDPKLWDDPESFKPERFKNKEDVSYKLLPFGLGRRACPGSGLAHRVMGLALGSLIQCFEWKRVDENEVDMNEGLGLTMPKAVPLEAMCKSCPVINKLLP